MPSQVDAAAAAIASALAPQPPSRYVRWRWGTVGAVNNDGTMNVTVDGVSLGSLNCAVHVMDAKVGDRVRVAYYGTGALVDAVLATSNVTLYSSIAWSGATPNADTFDCWYHANAVTVSVVDVKLTSSLSSGSNRVVGQLPSSMPYPAKSVYVQAVMAAGYANTWIKIDSDGSIRVSNRSGASLSTSTAITFSFTYFI